MFYIGFYMFYIGCNFDGLSVVTCLELFWNRFGTRSEFVWNRFRVCWERVRNMFVMCLIVGWNLFGTDLKDVSDLFWNLFGTCLKLF